MICAVTQMDRDFKGTLTIVPTIFKSICSLAREGGNASSVITFGDYSFADTVSDLILETANLF